MSDNFIRHLVAFLATLLCLIIYIAAYISGEQGWWWTVLGLFFIYSITYKIIDAGGH